MVSAIFQLFHFLTRIVPGEGFWFATLD